MEFSHILIGDTFNDGVTIKTLVFVQPDNHCLIRETMKKKQSIVNKVCNENEVLDSNSFYSAGSEILVRLQHVNIHKATSEHIVDGVDK